MRQNCLERNCLGFQQLRSRILVAHGLFGKPVPTFPDHARRKARPDRFVRAGEIDPFQGRRGVWGTEYHPLDIVAVGWGPGLADDVLIQTGNSKASCVHLIAIPAAVIAMLTLTGPQVRPIEIEAEPGENPLQASRRRVDNFGHEALLPNSVNPTIMLCRDGEVTAITESRYSISN
jgi:hypothetical protein